MTKESNKYLRGRITTAIVFVVVLFVALVSRAYQLQILSGEALKARAERQHRGVMELHTERGTIFDRNGRVLAASVLVDSVGVNPSMINNLDETAAKLSKILKINKVSLLAKFKKNRNFCWVARKISPEQSRRIRAQKISGIQLIEEPKRFYPNKNLAGHVLGFVGMDANGLAGLEFKYERYLKRVAQKISWGRDARGNQFYLDPRDGREDAEKNYNLILTIDSRIQHVVEQQLKRAVNETGARRATAIVMDPRTGEILAMACEPDFNPTVFYQYSGDVRKNWAIRDCFDPGSIFKPFVIAAALDEGAVTAADLFNCENGQYAVGDTVIREAERKKYGELVIGDVLKYSSNIGAVKIAERLGKEGLSRGIKKFGFAGETGIDLPGEGSGLMRSWTTWTDVDLATIAFGQGVSVTAIQMITALSALANEGILMCPQVVRGIVDDKGQVIREFVPSEKGRAVSAETARIVTSYLTGVVGDEDGTGRNARILNIPVAGKTGTAQKFDFAEGKYSTEKVTASFAGFFPANEPRMTILVVLDEPQTKRWGGQAAAPVFREVAQQVIRCFGTGMGEQEYDYDMDRHIEIQNVSIEESTIEQAEAGATLVPDFNGKTIGEVLRLARERNLDVRLKGSGWAVQQTPAPGTYAADGTVCAVLFQAD
ncbi:MAG: penicillin-binding protein [Deltaproteobacteria bacterium]|nr:penicillin-binding protein [Deltaproteobacteria bacterium]